MVTLLADLVQRRKCGGGGGEKHPPVLIRFSKESEA